MPKSLTSVVEELAKRADGPTRYDLYDFQRSVDRLTEMMGFDELESKIAELSDQVEVLSTAVNNLATVVAELSKKV